MTQNIQASTALSAQGATQSNAMPASGVVLLGTFTKFRAAHALIRNAAGRVEKVTIGDRLGRQQVVAIDPGTLVLMHNGQIQRLYVPGE